MGANEPDLKTDEIAIEAGPSGREADFRDVTRRQIAFRSGNVCAFPKCGRELVVDATEAGDGPAVVAQAAHIISSAPCGPRFDRSYGVAFRSSAQNGIYLCLEHAYLIDQQPQQYTAEWLFALKKEHEARVRSAVLREIAEVTFEELDAVVSSILAISVTGANANFDMPAEIDCKIRHNSLSEDSRALIEAGMTQTARVADYIEWATSQNANFFRRLTARYQAFYHYGVARGLEGDSLLNDILAAAEESAQVGVSERRRAAVLATTVRMFELCKILEVPDAAA